MDHVNRELDKLGRALRSQPNEARYAELYAAQQALAWSLDHQGLKSPASMIMGTREGSGDYLECHNQPQSSDISDRVSEL